MTKAANLMIFGLKKRKHITHKINPEFQTLVFAHRGSKSNRPENTLAAFREAVRVGSDGIELDVHLTHDEELVVIHDEKIDRTTNGRGIVRKMTLEALQRFDAGSWFSADFQGEKIPSLAEVLDLLTALRFSGSLNIEVKTDKYAYPGIEQKLATLMASKNWLFTYFYSSFNLRSLERLHVLEPEIELSYLMKNRPRKVKLALQTDFISSIHPRKNYAFKYPEQIALSKKPIRLWTINDETEMRWAFQKNIAGIFTDFPEQALSLQQELKKQSD